MNAVEFELDSKVMTKYSEPSSIDICITNLLTCQSKYCIDVLSKIYPDIDMQYAERGSHTKYL